MAPKMISRGAGKVTSTKSAPRCSERSDHMSSSAWRAASSSSSGEPSEPRRVPSGSTSILAPAPGPSRIVTTARRGRPRGRSRRSVPAASASVTARSARPRRRSRRRTAARRPTPLRRRCRSSSSCGAPPAMTSSATWMTAPSTQPPLTAPETSPLELIAIFAPGGRGAERLTLTTIAMATLSPRAVQASMSCRMSFIACPPGSRPARPARPASCRPGNDQYEAGPRPSRARAARSPAPP